MKTETDWIVLRALAEISPPEYAEQIRIRNQWALDALNDMVRSGVSNRRLKGFGCPHCSAGCMTCLWTAVTGSNHYSCTTVYFGGCALQDVAHVDRSAYVSYESGYVTVGVRCPLNTVQVEECRRFLEAHIEWANKDYWGQRYVNPDHQDRKGEGS